MASGTKDSSGNEDVTLIDLSKEFDAIIVGAGAAGIGRYFPRMLELKI